MRLGMVLIAAGALLASSASADIFTNADGLGVAPIITFEEAEFGVKQGNEWQPTTGITFDALLLYITDFFSAPGNDGKHLGGDMGTQRLTITFEAPRCFVWVGP